MSPKCALGLSAGAMGGCHPKGHLWAAGAVLEGSPHTKAAVIGSFDSLSDKSAAPEAGASHEEEEAVARAEDFGSSASHSRLHLVSEKAEDLGTLRQQLRRLCRDWRRMFGYSQLFGMLLGLVLFGVCLAGELDAEYPQANDMLAITVLVACFWMFEVLPLSITAVMPLALIPFAGIMPSTTVATAYWGWVQMLFLGAFLVDIAVEHVDLHTRIALRVLLKVGVGRPWLVMLCFLLISYFLSMWCSNTAATVMLVPFATGILDSACGESVGARSSQLRGFSTAVLLAVAYGSSCGGIATLIGTATNGVLAGLPIATKAIGSANWFWFAFPVSLASVGCVFLVLYFLFVRGTKLRLDHATVEQHYKVLGPLNRDELAVGIIQALQFAGFLIRPDVINNPAITNPFDLQGVNDATVACATAMLLFIVPSVKHPGETLLTWDKAQANLPWGVLILMGGGAALAQGFQSSKLTTYLGHLLAATARMNRLGLTFLITGACCLVTEVTSNTATANVVLPILAAVSTDALTHPLALLLPATVACSFAFMLPAATPPNAVVFATQRISILEMVKAGSVINVLVTIVGALVMYGTSEAVFNVEGPFPKWACLKESCRWVSPAGDGAGQACVLTRQQGICRLVDGTLLNYTHF